MSQLIDDNTKTLSNEKPSRRHALQAMGGLRFLLVVLVSLLALAPQSEHPSPAVAATLKSYTFTVNTTNDTHDAHPGDGKCRDSKGKCSLRAAIEESDALPTGSSITITVPKGTYKLTLGHLRLTANTITINGASRTTTIIKGNQQFGIISISANVSADLNKLTISGGNAAIGGGIYNAGMLTVSTSSVSGNKASSSNGNGGGIYNSGTLTVSSSSVSGNIATFGSGGYANGGGIYNSGTLIVSNSSVT